MAAVVGLRHLPRNASAHHRRLRPRGPQSGSFGGRLPSAASGDDCRGLRGLHPRASQPAHAEYGSAAAAAHATAPAHD